jgi:hypothetical protein
MKTRFKIFVLSENNWSAIDTPTSVMNNLALSGTAPVGVKATVICTFVTDARESDKLIAGCRKPRPWPIMAGNVTEDT